MMAAAGLLPFHSFFFGFGFLSLTSFDPLTFSSVFKFEATVAIHTFYIYSFVLLSNLLPIHCAVVSNLCAWAGDTRSKAHR